MHSDPTPHTPECRFGGAIRWSNGVTNWVTIVMEWLCVTCLHHTGAELNRNNRLLIAIVASDMTPSVNMTRPYVYKRHKDDERNRVLKHQTLCKQFKHITYDLSLFVHGSKGRGSHRHRNTMIIISERLSKQLAAVITTATSSVTLNVRYITLVMSNARYVCILNGW